MLDKLPIQPKEAQICKDFVKIVRELQNFKAFPKDFLLIHVANESISNKAYRMHQKAMGLVSGVADYLVLYEGGKLACIEFKRDKTCKQTDTQKWFEKRCETLGIPYLLTYEVDKALEFLSAL